MTNVDPHDDLGNKILLKDGYLNIQLLFEKEFLEECFDQRWAQTLKVAGTTWPQEVKDTAKTLLYGSDNEYQAKIYFTGIVFDLFNYRPEICALILIKSEKWFKDNKFSLSFEWDDAPVLDLYDECEYMPLVGPLSSVPAGIAAFDLGVQKARRLLRGEQ